MDNQLPKYHAIKSKRVALNGDKCVRTLPARDGIPSGADAGSSAHVIVYAMLIAVCAAKEAVLELAEYLSRRYPQVYSVERRHDNTGWYGQGQIKSITVMPVDATYDLDHEDPMKVAGLL